MRALVFELVPTLGLRETPTAKHVLDRIWSEVKVDGQPVRIKIGHRSGRVITATPEFPDVAAAAEATGQPQRSVLASAYAAAAAAGPVVGGDVPTAG